VALLDEIRSKREEILAIASRCALKDIKLFGSVVRREETAESDIDFLVDIVPGGDPLGFVDFQQQVEKLTQRHVDIVFKNGVHPLLRANIYRDATPL
jgi:uncharacterized protein